MLDSPAPAAPPSAPNPTADAPATAPGSDKGGGQGGNSGGGGDKDAAARAAGESPLNNRRKIAPIKGIPGVRPDLSARDRADQALLARGEADPVDNPLLATPAAGEEGEKPSKEGENEPPAVPQKVTFAGETYESMEEAEKAFKNTRRLLDMARKSQSSEAKQRQELANRLKAVEERVAAPPAPAQPLDTSDAALGIDAEELQFNRDLIEANEWIEEEGLSAKERAQRRAIVMNNVRLYEQRRSEQRMTALIEQRYGFLDEANQHIQFTTRADQAFDVVASEPSDPHTQDSTPAYPELHAPESTQRIAQAWDKMRKAGMPEGILYHPNFIKSLVFMYRGQFGPAKAPATPTQPQAVIAPRPPIPPPPRAPSVATGTGFPSTSTPTATPRTAGLMPGQRLPGVRPHI